MCIRDRFWRANGLPPLCIAVNVSPLTMRQAGFEDYCCRIKREHGVEDGEIELEFTESIAVQDYELFRSVLDRLHAEGFVCAMDDFGTGQSSLNVIQSLKVDVLKLDRLFFAPKGEPERQRIVLATSLSLARQLHMSTVAEWIEDEAQVEMCIRDRSQPMAYMGGLVATRSIGQFSTYYGGIDVYKRQPSDRAPSPGRIRRSS